jgi:hypothetical protein
MGITPKGKNLKFELRAFEDEFEKILGYDSRVHMGLTREKKEAGNLVLLSL